MTIGLLRLDNSDMSHTQAHAATLFHFSLFIFLYTVVIPILYKKLSAGLFVANQHILLKNYFLATEKEKPSWIQNNLAQGINLKFGIALQDFTNFTNYSLKNPMKDSSIIVGYILIIFYSGGKMNMCVSSLFLCLSLYNWLYLSMSCPPSFMNYVCITLRLTSRRPACHGERWFPSSKSLKIWEGVNLAPDQEGVYLFYRLRLTGHWPGT